MNRTRIVAAAVVMAVLIGLAGVYLFNGATEETAPPPPHAPPLVSPQPVGPAPAPGVMPPDAPPEPPAPTGPPGQFDFAVHSGARAWSRLELRLDAHWGSRTPEDAALTAVTLPDTRAMGRPRNRVIYQNRFSLGGALSRAARARLQIQGAVCTAKVYLNKKLLGVGPYPELPFSVDATGALKRSGENLLEIVVENRRALKLGKIFRPAPPIRAGRMSSASSLEIWKRAHLKGPVILVLTGDPAIVSARVTPSWRKREVAIAAVLSGSGPPKTGAAGLLAEVFFKGQRVAKKRWDGLKAAKGEETVSLKVPVPDPQPWGRPPHGQGDLYTLVLTLSRQAEVMDQRAYSFGFREAWVDDDQLKLNNRRLFLLTKRTAPNKHGQVSTERLWEISEKHGFNAWHVHFGNVQTGFFALCDELGQYAVPALLCAGAIEQAAQNDDARTRAFLNGYLRRWFEAFHNHPSIVLWGQELIYNMVHPNVDLGLDRPGLDVDIRGMYGSMGELRAFKAFTRTGKLKSYNGTSITGLCPGTGANLALIGEIHQEPAPARLYQILKDFPNLAGAILAFDVEAQAKDTSLSRLHAERPGLSNKPLAAKVLPAIRVTAAQDLCVLYGPYSAAPRYLSGALLGAGKVSRLATKEEGLLKIQALKKQGATEKAVSISRIRFTGKRPLIELGL